MSSKVEDLQSKISEHKEEINSLFEEKKELVSTKREMFRRLKKMIENIKILRSERSERVKKLKEHVGEREELKKGLKTLVSELRKLKDEKRKFGTSKTPRNLKNEIERIEWKIITDVLPFKKEQELTKKRVELEEELEEASGRASVYKDERKLKQDITLKVAREKSEHAEFVKYANKADEIKANIKKLSDEIEKQKKALDEINKKLDKNTARRKELSKLISKSKSKIEKKKKSKNQKAIEGKLAEVKRKFKEKKKLTTDDLIVLSASDENLLKE